MEAAEALKMYKQIPQMDEGSALVGSISDMVYAEELSKQKNQAEHT